MAGQVSGWLGFRPRPRLSAANKENNMGNLNKLASVRIEVLLAGTGTALVAA